MAVHDAASFRVFAVSGGYALLKQAKPAQAMTGLPDPARILSYHGEYAVTASAALTHLSGGQILGAIGVIAVVSVVLWIPVLWDQLTAFLSINAAKWVPRVFVAGLALVVTGLMAGVDILAIVGGCTIGGLAAALLYENY
jgi:hypothetical protein